MPYVPRDLQSVAASLKFADVPSAWTYRYRHVALRDSDDVRILVANGPRQGFSMITEARKGQLPCTEVIRPLDLLLSWLELVQEPFDSAELDRCVPPEHAVAWCERYGLPWVQGEEVDGSMECLSLWELQDQVLTLYRFSQLWMAYQWQDRECFKDMWKKGIPDLPIVNIDEHGREIAESMRQSTRFQWSPTAKWDRQFSRYTTSLRGQLNTRLPHSRTSQSLSTGQWTLSADRDLFIIGYSVLEALTQLPQGELPATTKTYTVCAACRNSFWGHGNARYCPTCDRRTRWSRTHPRPQTVSRRRKPSPTSGMR